VGFILSPLKLKLKLKIKLKLKLKSHPVIFRVSML